MDQERVVRFYRITDKDQLPFPNEFPFGELQGTIQDLPDQDAYVVLNRMELLGSAWTTGSGAPPRPRAPLVALDRITRDPQLRVERRRHYRPLVLGDGENLADPTFYTVFDDGVLAVLRTSSLAPGPASFRDYVNHLEIVKPEISITPLVDGNAVRALSQVGTLTRLTVAVGPDVSPETFRQSPMILDVIRTARQSLGTVAVEVTIKIAAKGQAAAAEEAHRQIRNIVTSDALAYTEKANIKFRRIEDGRADAHDFLQEAVTHSTSIELDAQTRQPIESSVAEAIAAAYNDLYDDIRAALRPPA